MDLKVSKMQPVRWSISTIIAVISVVINILLIIFNSGFFIGKVSDSLSSLAKNQIQYSSDLRTLQTNNNTLQISINNLEADINNLQTNIHIDETNLHDTDQRLTYLYVEVAKRYPTINYPVLSKFSAEKHLSDSSFRETLAIVTSSPKDKAVEYLMQQKGFSETQALAVFNTNAAQ